MIAFVLFLFGHRAIPATRTAPDSMAAVIEEVVRLRADLSIA